MEEPDTVPVLPPADLGWYGAVKADFLGKTEIMEGLDLAGWETCRIFFGDLRKTPLSSEVLGSSGRYTLIKRFIETPRGQLQSVLYRSTQICMQDWTVEHFAKSVDDIERFLSILYEPYDATLDVRRDFAYGTEGDLQTHKSLGTKIGDNGLVYILIPDPTALLFFLCGVEFAAKLCYRNFDLVQDLLRAGLERALDYVEHLHSLGVYYFIIVGPEYVGVFMPHLLDKIVVPYERKIVSAIHQGNTIAEIHCHGKVNNQLENFAATGADALDPLEPPLTGDIQDLGDAKKRIGDRICLVGNVSYKELEDRVSTDCAVHDRIKSAAAGGGYVLSVVYSPLSLREGTPSDIPPLESVLEFVKAAGKYEKYSRIA